MGLSEDETALGNNAFPLRGLHIKEQHTAAFIGQRRGKNDRCARAERGMKFHPRDGCEKHDARFHRGISCGYSGCLCHGFDQQHSWNDGISRKMTREEWKVSAERLLTSCADSRKMLENFIHKNERLTMGKNRYRQSLQLRLSARCSRLHHAQLPLTKYANRQPPRVFTIPAR